MFQIMIFKMYYNLVKNFSDWQNYFHYKNNKSDSVKLTTRKRGIEIVVPRKLMGVFKEIFFNDFYDIGLLKKITKPSPVVVDIGANAGYFTILSNNYFNPELVLAYEPIPTNYRMLINNLRFDKNKINKAFQKAVGKPGLEKIELNIDVNDELTVTASSYSKINSGEIRLAVECTDLPKIFEENNLNNIDLLKMDCEGSEYDVFYTLDEKYWEKIFVITMEVHEIDSERNNLFSLTKFLMSKNYKLKVKRINNETSMLWGWKQK